VGEGAGRPERVLEGRLYSAWSSATRRACPEGAKGLRWFPIVPIVVLVLVLVIDFENHTKATLEPFPRLRDERTSSISCRDLF
jgi:hypothetical protein